MPHRRSRAKRVARILRAASFVLFMIAGGFYVFAPTISSTDFFNSPVPAMSWGVVFFIGGAIALRGGLGGLPYLERLGVSLVVIAGAVLTLNQGALMLESPVTWTRGGGTAAYGAFTVLAASLLPEIRNRGGIIDLAADIRSGELEDGFRTP